MNYALNQLENDELFILKEIFTFRNSKLFSERKIEIPLVELTKRMHNTQHITEQLLTKTENTIIHLANKFFNIENIETKEKVGFRFLDHYSIPLDKNIIILSISNYLFDTIMDKVLLNFYSSEIKSLEKTINPNLFFNLLKYRVFVHISSKKDLTLEYKEINLKIYYENITKQRELKTTLIKDLENIKKTSFIVEDYKEKYSSYTIKFTPFIQNEIDYFILNGDTSNDELFNLK